MTNIDYKKDNKNDYDINIPNNYCIPCYNDLPIKDNRVVNLCNNYKGNYIINVLKTIKQIIQINFYQK